jgi:hypothetical protein
MVYRNIIKFNGKRRVQNKERKPIASDLRTGRTTHGTIRTNP